MQKKLWMLLACLFAPLVFGDENIRETPELTAEELSSYEFDNDQVDNPVKIEALSVGQKFILDSKRQDMEDLVTRRLGVLKLGQGVEDLRTIQQLVDRRLIKARDVEEWQSLGVVFGDILANEFDLHWISYEDRLGLSKALRWKETDNFVFPITVFSRRIRFKQEIDAAAIFDKIEQEIIAFKEYERRTLKI